MATRQEFAEATIPLVGIRWVHQGRSPKGLDCIGVPLLAAEACGLIEDMSTLTPNYGRRPDGGLLERMEKYGLIQIPPGDRRVGDILVFSLNGEPWHIGVLVSLAPQEIMVHGFFKNRRVTMHVLDTHPNQSCGLLTHVFKIPWLEDA